MLADAAKSVRGDSEYVYDRHAVRRERAKNEIGIHSIRGGTIVGEHEVIFAGPDEVIRISHSAYSRDVFASERCAPRCSSPVSGRPDVFDDRHAVRGGRRGTPCLETGIGSVTFRGLAPQAIAD